MGFISIGVLLKEKLEGSRKSNKYCLKIEIKIAEIDDEILKQNYQNLLNTLIKNFGIFNTGTSQNGGSNNACSDIHES